MCLSAVVFAGWVLLEAPGKSWKLLEAPGSSWKLLEAPGNAVFRERLEAPGSSWKRRWPVSWKSPGDFAGNALTNSPSEKRKRETEMKTKHIHQKTCFKHDKPIYRKFLHNTPFEGAKRVAKNYFRIIFGNADPS